MKRRTVLAGVVTAAGGGLVLAATARERERGYGTGRYGTVSYGR